MTREIIPKGIRFEVFNRDNFCCQICKGREELEIDHIIPVSRGGTDLLSNLRTLCKKCNLDKSNLIHDIRLDPNLCLICQKNSKDDGCRIIFVWNGKEARGYTNICIKCWDDRFDFGYCGYDKIGELLNVK